MFKKKDGKTKLLQALQADKDVAQVLSETLGEYAQTWYQTRLQNQPQRLVTEAGEFVSEFTANGKTYYIRNPKEGLPLRRAMELEKMSVVIPFNAGLGEVVASLQRMKGIVNGFAGAGNMNIAGLIEEIVNLEKGLRGEGDRKYPASLMMCTLFIFEPNEDLRTWDVQSANQKIDNWVMEGLLFEDFFLLAMQWSTHKYVLQAESLEKVKRALRVFGLQDL